MSFCRVLFLQDSLLLNRIGSYTVLSTKLHSGFYQNKLANTRRAQILAKNGSYTTRNLAIQLVKREC